MNALHWCARSDAEEEGEKVGNGEDGCLNIKCETAAVETKPKPRFAISDQRRLRDIRLSRNFLATQCERSDKKAQAKILLHNNASSFFHMGTDYIVAYSSFYKCEMSGRKKQNGALLRFEKEGRKEPDCSASSMEHPGSSSPAEVLILFFGIGRGWSERFCCTDV